MAVDSHVADLASHSSMATPQTVVEDYRSPDASSDGDEKHAPGRLILPALQLGHGRGVHVVVQHARHAELLGKLIG
jgi:hypothetical protein